MPAPRWPPRTVSAIGCLSGLPDAALAGAYLVAWIDPSLLPAHAPTYLLAVLLLEAITIVASGLMAGVLVGEAGRAYRAASLLGLGAAFTVVTVLVARRFDADWMTWAFWLLVLNKLLGLLLGQVSTEQQRDFVTSSWISALALYLLGWLVSWLPLPPLGLSLLQVDLAAFGSMAWTREPQRFLAWGFSYFLLLALSEATSHTWLGRVIERFFGDWVLGARR